MNNQVFYSRSVVFQGVFHVSGGDWGKDLSNRPNVRGDDPARRVRLH